MREEFQLPTRADWGPGPWDKEPDRAEWRDRATGYVCLAVRHPRYGHWCGYVGVPPGHPSHGKDYDDVPVSVHGGLTYSDVCDEGGLVCHVPAPGEPEDLWWLGFDCHHFMDVAPGMDALTAKLRDTAPEPQRTELERIDRQLAAYEDRLPRVYRTLVYVKRECRSLARQLKKLA